MANSQLDKVRILVVSDSHTDTCFINNLLNKEKNIDYFFHLGDSELPSEYISPFVGVEGNCDYYEYPKAKIVEINNKRLYLFHGHTMRLTIDNLVLLAKSNNCDIIMHGHTHTPYIEYIDGVYVMCPGSIRYPRYDYPTYAIIEIDKNVVIRIKEYESGE